MTTLSIKLGSLSLMPAVQPPQPLTTNTKFEKNVVYIINCVWAVVYRNTGKVFSKNRLNPCIQNTADGKQQWLETFRNKLVDARRRGLHFVQVRSRYVARWQSYEHGKKVPTDGWMDRRLFVFI